VGTHTITVVKSYANGCSSTATINITVNALPDATINNVNATNTVCSDAATIQLTAATSGGSWSGPGTTAGGMFTAASAGQGTHTIVYTVTDGNGCSNSDDIQITVAPAIVITGDVSDAGCEGAVDGSIDITVNGGTPGFNYQWSSGQQTQDVNKVPAGSYTVTVTDANGCSETASYTVGEPTPITIIPIAVENATTPQFTNGSIDITPAGGTPPYNFIWSNGETTEDISDLPADTYHVTVMDSHGCRFYFDIDVDAEYGLGIDLADLTNGLKVYPNPTDGMLQVELSLGVTAEVIVTMHDVLGRMLFATNGTIANTYSETIDMSAWSSGQYVLTVQVGEHIVQSKVVLTK
jgi:hypothetical protein